MTANEIMKSIKDNLDSVEQNLERMIPIDVIADIVSEIESQDPADYGRSFQEKAAAENMKRNILEIIKERVEK